VAQRLRLGLPAPKSTGDVSGGQATMYFSSGSPRPEAFLDACPDGTWRHLVEGPTPLGTRNSNARTCREESTKPLEKVVEAAGVEPQNV